MRTRFILSTLSIVLLTSAAVSAQLSDVEKPRKEIERRQELERKTLDMLDGIVAEAWGLKLPENRAFVLSSAADVLWPRDEKRARNLFWDALSSLGLTANVPGSNPPVKGSAAEKTRKQNQYYATFATRQEFLRQVAQHDPELALEMLRATRQPEPEPLPDGFRPPDDRDLEQQIANEAATRDPKRALQIARDSLAKGLTFQLLNFLWRINQRSPETATEFAGDIIDKIQTANLATDMYASRIAIELLRFARTSPVAESENVPGPIARRLTLNEDQKRELVEALVSAALNTSVGANLFSLLSEVMPEVEEFAPDRAPLLKKKLIEFNRLLPRQQQDLNTYNALFERGSAEEMIKAAAGVGSEVRDTLYQQAVVIAVLRGRADALREVISNQIEDESRRKSVIDLLDAEQTGYAAARGKTEELQKLLPQIRLKEARALAMAELAILLEKKGEHDEALKLLDEAHTLVKVDLKNETRTNALMALVLGYALVDPPRAFAIIEPIVDRANDDISKLLLLDKVFKSGAVKKGEIILQGSGVVPLDFAALKYGKGVAALANADFNRTKAVADRFQRNELRVIARLMIAKALLQNNEQVVKNDQQ